MVEAQLEDIAVSGDGSQILMLLKTKQGDEVLPIVIDMAQAISIAMARSGEATQRPLTHDLMLTTLGLFDAKVARIEITDLIEGTFYAMLVLERQGVRFDVDARPSDALALAVRTEAPIFIAEHVLERNALSDDLFDDSEGGSSGFEA